MIPFATVEDLPLERNVIREGGAPIDTEWKHLKIKVCMIEAGILQINKRKTRYG